nr:MAG TPA: hypothetical protein [Caudoviricetes sp.]
MTASEGLSFVSPIPKDGAYTASLCAHCLSVCEAVYIWRLQPCKAVAASGRGQS